MVLFRYHGDVTALLLIVGVTGAAGIAAQLVAPEDAGVADDHDVVDADDAGSRERPPIADEPPFSIDATGAEQMVLVVVDDWRSTKGVLKRLEKVGARWMQVGGPIEVSVGDSGLGWGLGLHPLGAGEPRKIEGDARSPAGVFRLVSAFGYSAPAVKTDMPFLITKGHVCIDDPRHEGYNRIVVSSADAARVGVKLDDFDRYAVGLLFDHNAAGALEGVPKKGRGSCPFLHVWKRRGMTTDGGTAMARDDLDRLVGWLDPTHKPVLVQLTRRELAMKRGLWGIP